MGATNVRIIDATLREGNQAPGVQFTAEQSQEIARLLVAAGVDMIECGHASASKAEFERVAAVAKLGLDVPLMAHARAHWQDVRAVADAGASWIGIFCGVNDISLQFRLHGRQGAEVLSRIYDSISYARGLGLNVRYTIEDASRTSFDRMIATYRRAIDAGANRICFADTLGLQDPLLFRPLVAQLKEHFPDVDLEVHLHDDRGLAMANALAAIDGGAEWVSTSVNGLGERCGIVDLALCQANLSHLGIREIRNPSVLLYLSRYVAAVARTPVNSMRPVVGKNAFTHKAALHVRAVAADESTYSWLPPQRVGRATRIAQASQYTFDALVKRPLEIPSTELRYHRKGPGTRYVMMDERLVADCRQYCIVRHIPPQQESQPGHVDVHRHDVDSLFLFLGASQNLEGLEVEVQVGDERCCVQSPASVFIPAGVPHSYRVLGGTGYYVNHVLAGSYDASLLDAFQAPESGGAPAADASPESAPPRPSKDLPRARSAEEGWTPVHETIAAFIAEKTGTPAHELTLDLHLVESGLLDSLLIIELFFYVEKLVGDAIPTEGFRVDTFDTIRKIHDNWINPQLRRSKNESVVCHAG